jgi:hypothetical protein
MNGTIGLRSKNAVVRPLAPESGILAPDSRPAHLREHDTPEPPITGDPLARLEAKRLGISDAYEAALNPLEVPPSWTKGQLLNVRNRGEFYVVTLLGEEDEPPLKPAPSGALRFTNTPLCQDFISRWYARESHDPRAR